MSHPHPERNLHHPASPLEVRVHDMGPAPEREEAADGAAGPLGATGLSGVEYTLPTGSRVTFDGETFSGSLSGKLELPEAVAPAPEPAAALAPEAEPVKAAPAEEQTALPLSEAIKRAISESIGKAVDDRAAGMRKELRKQGIHEEPGSGYWEFLGGALTPTERKTWKDELEARRADAASRAEDEQTTTDKFVLSREQTYDPYHHLARDIVESLRDETGEKPELEELVTDTGDLEGVTRLFLLSGLLGHSSNHTRGDLRLYDALALMTEATKAVPDFDPERAGLAELEDHTIFQLALLRMESPHRAFARRGAHNQGDPVWAMVGACSEAVKEVNTELTMRDIRASRILP